MNKILGKIRAFYKKLMSILRVCVYGLALILAMPLIMVVAAMVLSYRHGVRLAELGATIEVEAEPVEAEPVKVEAEPIEVKAEPVEVKAEPIEVKAEPVETFAPPLMAVPSMA